MISIKNVLSLITSVAALFVVIRSEISDLNPLRTSAFALTPAIVTYEIQVCDVSNFQI